MHVAIIGNGISGITAARTIRKNSDFRITVISSESEYFFSRTALMYIYMGHMKFEHTKPYEDFFWKKNRIDLLYDHVQKIDFQKLTLHLENSPSISCDKLLICTGSKSNKFGWPGQELQGVQGLYNLQDLDLLEKNTHPAFTPMAKRKVKKAVIVGGGLIGIELAEMLSTRRIKPIFLIREDRFWGNVLPRQEGEMIGRHLSQHGVELRFNTELMEIIGDGHGRVRQIVTKNGESIDCEFVGLTPGVHPNIDLVDKSELETNKGILVDNKLKTSIEHVYAAGDCVEFRNPPRGRKAIEPVWYTGRMMGEVAGLNLIGREKEYNPGPWFNSAKFFDIEYQTYGQVPSEIGKGYLTFYWEHESGNCCFRLVGDENHGRFIGLHALGLRLRHEVVDKWLRQGVSPGFVMEHLKDAIFNPEIFPDVTRSIIKAYNIEFGTSINLKSKKWKRILSI